MPKMLIGYWLIIFPTCMVYMTSAETNKKSLSSIIFFLCTMKCRMKLWFTKNVLRKDTDNKLPNKKNTDTVGKPSTHSVEAQEKFDWILNVQFGRLNFSQILGQSWVNNSRWNGTSYVFQWNMVYRSLCCLLLFGWQTSSL